MHQFPMKKTQFCGKITNKLHYSQEKSRKFSSLCIEIIVIQHIFLLKCLVLCPVSRMCVQLIHPRKFFQFSYSFLGKNLSVCELFTTFAGRT